MYERLTLLVPRPAGVVDLANPNEKTKIAIVQLSEAYCDFWADLASDLGFDTVMTTSRSDAVPSGVAAVVLAVGGTEEDAIAWLEEHDWPEATPVIVVGADPNRRLAVQVVSRGAKDYLVLPHDLDLLRSSVGECLARYRQTHHVAENAEAIKCDAFANIVGESSAIKEVLWLAARVLPHQKATALILGETGTGKELMARALHFGGPRREGPFVPVNCSALPNHLIESELFGHEKGAFTDAHSSKPGLFEIADGGTLFLDEIGDLPLELQAKLLRVLDDGQIRRVGGTKSRAVDVRIVAATNENLEQAVRDGKFREDLYFRLSVIVLSLPPLRARDSDVVLIAEALLEAAAEQHGLPAPKLTTEAKSALGGYHWPGNVRELKNAVERALLLSPPGELHMNPHLPLHASLGAASNVVIPFPASLHEINRAAAKATLEHCDGNRSESARRLGITRRRLRGLLDESEPSQAEELARAG